MHRSLFRTLVASPGIVLCSSLSAQASMQDSSIFMVPITLSYAYQVPSGDLALRFGPNSNLGISAYAKFKSKFFLGLEASFLFGNQVVESGLLRGVRDSEGEILDANGDVAAVLLFERGYSLLATAGRLMPIVGPNPNSGLVLKLGVGMLRHKVRIETQNNVVPQLEGDYLEGYDRLTAGPAALLSVGYLHISNRRLLNFQVGFEMMLGFTEPLRAYNFDTGTRDAAGRHDMLTGIRAGWTLPLYRRVATDYYIY
jgi:hypothetical protein